MSRYDVLLNSPRPAEPAPDAQEIRSRRQANRSSQAPGATTRQPPRSLDHQTDQSTNQSINRSIRSSASTKVMEKPRGFYITERLNQRLNDAVRYYQEAHGIKKVDRSVIISAMLDDDARWTDDALDQLVEQVMSQLTSRLTA